jgi:hypothetical protein
MISEQYVMKDLGQIQKYLCIELDFSPQGIVMHQCSYADQIIFNAGMGYSRPASTPLPIGIELVTDIGSSPTDPTSYGHFVGQLMFCPKLDWILHKPSVL